MAARHRLLLVALAPLWVTASACSDDQLTTDPYVVPTEVAVDPGDFLGEVQCSSNPGAAQSYVVTLIQYSNAEDEEQDITPFTLGSSLPTPCSVVAGFRHVVLGDRYTAEVDVYDVAAAELTAFGQPSSGARQMLSTSDGELVAPRWETQCGGSASTGAVARENVRTFMRPCDLIEDASPRPTRLALAPSAILGPDPCSVAATLDVADEGGALPTVSGLPCDAEPLLYDAVAGRSYQLYAVATVAETEQGALCYATARAGETVSPSCNPLSSRGHIRLSVAGLSAGTEPLCPAGALYDVLEAGEVLNTLPLPCEAATTIGPHEAGTALLDLVIYDPTGESLAEASCAATVAPGKTVEAFCLPT